MPSAMVRPVTDYHSRGGEPGHYSFILLDFGQHQKSKVCRNRAGCLHEYAAFNHCSELQASVSQHISGCGVVAVAIEPAELTPSWPAPS